MGHISNGEAAAPEPDIMQLARVGDIPAMQKLFEAGDIDATYADNDGITPLHVCLYRYYLVITWHSSTYLSYLSYLRILTACLSVSRGPFLGTF